MKGESSDGESVRVGVGWGGGLKDGHLTQRGRRRVLSRCPFIPGMTIQLLIYLAAQRRVTHNMTCISVSQCPAQELRAGNMIR